MGTKNFTLYSDNYIHYFAEMSLVESIKALLANNIASNIKKTYNIRISSLSIYKEIRKNKYKDRKKQGMFSYPCFNLAKKLGLPPEVVAKNLKNKKE